MPELRDPKLQSLIDKQDIYDVLMRYCHGIDRADLGVILSAFHDDAGDNHSGVVESAVERFTRTVELGRSMRTSHNLTNVLIQVDGDVAHSQSYFIACHHFDHDGARIEWVLNGRYLDRHERRAGEWRIAHRAVVYDLESFSSAGLKAAGHPAADALKHAIWGDKSRADSSYDVLRF